MKKKSFNNWLPHPNHALYMNAFRNMMKHIEKRFLESGGCKKEAQKNYEQSGYKDISSREFAINVIGEIEGTNLYAQLDKLKEKYPI